jgi:hypothetical protein
VKASASAYWNGMSLRSRYVTVSMLRLAATQPSLLPLFQALCWSDQLCAKSPTNWDPKNGCCGRNGRIVPAPFGCWNTELPDGRVTARGSLKPRTPRSEPK